MPLPRALPLLLLLLLAPAPLRAQQQEAQRKEPPALSAGPYVGVQLGFGLPLGRFEQGEDGGYLSEVYDSALPVQLDVGYRFGPHLRAGAYATYARLATHGFCPGGLQCSARLLRFGLVGEYHFAPRRPLHGWVGLGLGHERSGVRIAGRGVDVETRYQGLEWLGVSAGADYRLFRALTIGPALTWTFGRYGSRSSRLGSGSGAEALPRPALHCWVLLGARAQWAF
uniref:Outer membrane protein beta-barrel domain-containing protein n=1 Tax=Simulacricoccus ruber TaxID=2303410 RepID=A0A3S7UVN3_9BACT|nr:hypothetical protein [Simulacricoccus ruber]